MKYHLFFFLHVFSRRFKLSCLYSIFLQWITSEVLPAIRNTGTYTLNQITNTESDNETKIEEYKNTVCVYILHIKDNIYKFGVSSDIETRLNNHRNKLDFNKTIKIYKFENLNNAKLFETRIKYFLKNIKY